MLRLPAIVDDEKVTPEEPPDMLCRCRGCGNAGLDPYNDYRCVRCGCANNVVLSSADDPNREATDEDILEIQEQLRLTANDPNLRIVSAFHFSYGQEKDENHADTTE